MRDAKARAANIPQDAEQPQHLDGSEIIEANWGTFASVATFNVNRMPWSRLSQYLDLLGTEFDASVLALQEVLDDSPQHDIVDGWWEFGDFYGLTTHTHDSLIMCFLMHKSFAKKPTMDYSIKKYSIAVTGQLTASLFGINTRLVAVYIQPVGHDRLEQNMFLGALSDIEQEITDYPHNLLFGDWNAWLGRTPFRGGRGGHIGPYNLEKVNDRGNELGQWVAANGMVVTSTIMEHATLFT
eukprot:675855-Amphidinium_carterae.1